MEPNLYARPLTVTLTVSEWLTLHCALWHALDYCDHAALPCIGQGYRELKDIIGAQTGAAIGAAAEQQEAAERANAALVA